MHVDALSNCGKRKCPRGASKPKGSSTAARKCKKAQHRGAALLDAAWKT